MLVYPSQTPETATHALESKPYVVKRIQRIYVNPDGSKHPKGKRHLGSNGNESAAFVIPPLKEQVDSKHAVVCEGLEDAPGNGTPRRAERGQCHISGMGHRCPQPPVPGIEPC